MNATDRSLGPHEAIEMLTLMSQMEQRTCDRFAESFANDPHDAFSWGIDALEAAAKVKVYGLIARSLANTNSKATVASTAAFALDRALELGRVMHNSTSALSNLARDAERCAWVRAYKSLSGER